MTRFFNPIKRYQQVHSNSWIKRPGVLALVVIVLSLSLYTLTLAPDLVWGGGDFALYQTRANLNQIVYNGHVHDHALWVALAHPFTLLPVRSPAWRANFASAVFASLALGLLFIVSWKITRSRFASLLAVGALALSHTFWTYAVLPEVYSLNALSLAVCFLLLLIWRSQHHPGYLYLVSFLFGLSFLIHLQTILIIPGFVALVLLHYQSINQDQAAYPTPGLSLLSFAIGLIPYLLLLSSTQSFGNNSSVIFSYLRGFVYTLAHPRILLNGLGWGAMLWLYQFPLTFTAGFIGLYTLWHKDKGVALFIGMAILFVGMFLLAARDPRAAREYVYNLHFYLLAYVAFAPAIAAGLKVVLQKLPDERHLWKAASAFVTLIVPILTYTLAPEVARQILPDVPEFRPLPGRDNFTYALSPWKHLENGARSYAENILSALPQDSVLFADYSIWWMIRYLQQVEGQRLDVNLLRIDNVRDQLGLILEYKQRPHLYLADTYRYYDVQAIGDHFFIIKEGPVYRLED